MKLNWKAYTVFGLVFIASLLAAILVPEVDDMLRGAFAAPGILALLGALHQLMRDEADHERRTEMQRKEFQFTLGAASHMANAAFDKHAAFCEAYMKELHEAVRTLYRDGGSEKVLQHASRLYQIRQEYAVWLTDRINEELDTFETALRKLGANAHFINATSGAPEMREKRTLRIEENSDLFDKILGITGKSIKEDSMVMSLTGKVKSILRVEDLTALREHLIQKSSLAIKD